MSAPVIALLALAAAAPAASADDAALERDFGATVRPYLDGFCVKCHSGAKAKGDLDLTRYPSAATVATDHARWATVLEKLTAGEMPPKKKKTQSAGEAPPQPARAATTKVIVWIKALRAHEARKGAGDPGVVLARRLSNAEYNYTIRDLTGVDLQPTREFPVDPTNPAGFDNSGESLAMSPALLGKYLQAAREVANHMVLRQHELAFAPHLVLVDTDRDKYCVQRIVDFYRRQDTDFADYFLAAWRFKHRAALGQPKATLADVAAASHVSAKYLATVWQALTEDKPEVGPLAKLQAQWRALPAPHGSARQAPEQVLAGCGRMRGLVTGLRKKLEPRFAAPSVDGIRGNAQPLIMWRNQQYASHRMDFDRAALQVDGEPRPLLAVAPPKKKKAPAADDDDVEDEATPPARAAADPDLQVPAGQRARYEAAFARFAAVFPDTFYMAERGRNYLDPGRERGRLLSAGFHNLMGYFRDDQPLYQLVLDERGRAELDELWQDLDFVASATARTFTQFYLSESGLARKAAQGSGAVEGAGITTEATIKKAAAGYVTRAGDNPVARKAVEDHFADVNTRLRWAEGARAAAEPAHLEALLAFAARAYRRPLAAREREDLLAYYHSLRAQQSLDHEAALRDSIVSVLMSPDFCYRIDLAPGGAVGVGRLTDGALASRLSYFLWSSMPDAALLAEAAAGRLNQPAVLIAQARRMLQDPRAGGLAAEFGGNWLDFRRFEEHNAVDRQRFPSFDDGLRAAMFEEPIRFLDDVIRHDRPVLDLLYGRHTFVNAALAKHYGMTAVAPPAGQWVRVDDARAFGRGGLLPMAVFLTQNAPGLRTSPVKRGYWVVRRVLGEQIPPPPAVVPELPRDEAKLDAPLREVLASHRADPSCAGCHARFDAFGLAFEGYGPVGERRTTDLAGRAVDARATFADGTSATGLGGLQSYVRGHRQQDFVDNLCRKLLVYALGRSLLLSDDPTLDKMRARLAKGGYRFSALVEEIVTSPQFLNKRGGDLHAQQKEDR